MPEKRGPAKVLVLLHPRQQHIIVVNVLPAHHPARKPCGSIRGNSRFAHLCRKGPYGKQLELVICIAPHVTQIYGKLFLALGSDNQRECAGALNELSSEVFLGHAHGKKRLLLRNKHGSRSHYVALFIVGGADKNDRAGKPAGNRVQGSANRICLLEVLFSTNIAQRRQCFYN